MSTGKIPTTSHIHINGVSRSDEMKPSQMESMLWSSEELPSSLEERIKRASQMGTLNSDSFLNGTFKLMASRR